MAKVKVKLNFKGMGELLRSSEMGDMLAERMARVQAALPGSIMEIRPRRSRISAVVKRGSDFDEANTGDLSRALDLAGGQRGTQVVTKKSRRT
jgi:hypothetical protein